MNRTLQIFRNNTLTQFLEHIEQKKMVWIVKRLSGNDTGLTGGHQAGVYLPKDFLSRTFPEIMIHDRLNPRVSIQECYFPNADTEIMNLQVIYYNNKFHGHTRDEVRITSWGGKKSPTNDVENTGATFIFALSRDSGGYHAVGWVAESIAEEELIDAWLGTEVDPGQFYQSYALEKTEKFFLDDIPEAWYQLFPSGDEIFDYIVHKIPGKAYTGSLDKLLLDRRKMEFLIYQHIEEYNVLPVIQKGFNSVDSFMKLALSVANRRKSRTGRSLELNLEYIFRDEKLFFDTQAETENGKKPDFIFPSVKAYRDSAFPAGQLRLVAAKTTCKDRWRQVIDEADRIRPKHLFTLQQGVSSRQLMQMEQSSIQLVVPEPYLSKYPREWQSRILTLEQLTDHVRANQEQIQDIDRWIA